MTTAPDLPESRIEDGQVDSILRSQAAQHDLKSWVRSPSPEQDCVGRGLLDIRHQGHDFCWQIRGFRHNSAIRKEGSPISGFPAYPVFGIGPRADGHYPRT